MLLKRFLDYVSYETTSSEESASSPSTSIQLKLAEHLKDELNELKIEDVYLSDNGYVYGTLKGEKDMPVIGLCSHNNLRYVFISSPAILTPLLSAFTCFATMSIAILHKNKFVPIPAVAVIPVVS